MVPKAVRIVHRFPHHPSDQPLSSIVGAWTSDTRKVQHDTVPLLEPMIKERLAKMEKFGDNWADKPVSLCSFRTEEP